MVLNIPINFETLLEIINQLPDEQKRLLRQHLEDQEKSKPAVAPKKRVAGLFEGSIWMSDDFDDPLPEEFWLGEDA